MYSRPQKLAAEFLGTFAVVLFSAGSICAEQFLRGANSGAISLLGMALAYGFAYAGMSAALAHISGAHFNPAVTVGFWVTRRLGSFEALSYAVVQAGGAIAAAYALRFVIPEPVWQAVALGAPGVANGISRLPAMLIEGFATFFVVFVIFAAQSGDRSSMFLPGSLAGGLAISVGSLFAGPFTGGAMNPARALGPALLANHWTNQGVYWVGPLAGGMFAAWLYDSVLARPAKRA